MATALSTLRTRARIRADAVANLFFTDSEIDQYLNVALGELHDMLVLKFEDYYVSSVEFSLVNDKSRYSFDEIGLNNLYKCLGVDVTDSGSTLRVHRFSFPERNRYNSSEGIVGRGGYADYQYQLQGDALSFIPSPNTTSTVKVWYVPSFSPLENDDDEINSSIMSNWEEFAILSAVYKMKEKEELSTTVIERELAALRARVDQAASNRDAGEPFGITDEMLGASDGWLRGFS